VTPGYVTIGPGSTVSGGNVNFHLWGAGLMINAAPLGWARGAVGEFNMDTEYTYDPHAEIGAFGFAAIPFMYGLGIEAQAGIGYEDLSGTYVFFRIEVLALGHRLNRLPP
jgi:hypothetical protein